jgi:hypothetical protein
VGSRFLWMVFWGDSMDECKQTMQYVLFHIAILHNCAGVSQLSSLQVMSTVTHDSHIAFNKGAAMVHTLCTAAAKAVRCVNHFYVSHFMWCHSFYRKH